MSFEYLIWPQSQPEGFKGKTLILLHGYGADAWDLMGLLESTPDEKLQGLQVWLLQGPLEVDFDGWHRGRAWWPLDSRWLMQPHPSQWMDLAIESLDQLILDLQRWCQDHQIDPTSTVVGGFSQGAITSLWWAWLSQKPFAGVLAFSPTLTWKSRAQKLWQKATLKPPIWISHGQWDPVLPILGTRQLVMGLKENQWPVIFREFPGTHEIPLEIWLEGLKFVHNLSSKP